MCFSNLEGSAIPSKAGLSLRLSVLEREEHTHCGLGRRVMLCPLHASHDELQLDYDIGARWLTRAGPVLEVPSRLPAHGSTARETAGEL